MIREPNDGYWDNVWLKKPFYASYWAGRPTCDWMFTTAYAAEAVWNETFWKNPRFNELLVAARSETDDTKRAGMYAEMQQLLHDDGGLINLVFNSYVDAHTKALAHGEVASNWPMDGHEDRRTLVVRLGRVLINWDGGLDAFDVSLSPNSGSGADIAAGPSWATSGNPWRASRVHQLPLILDSASFA